LCPHKQSRAKLNISKYNYLIFNLLKKMKRTIKILSIAMLLAIVSVTTSFKTAPASVIKLGFIPLTDCAPLVVAKELGLFKKYGVNVELSKEASWANIRDKVLNGELSGAHCLFSMPLSVYTGIGGKTGSQMKIAMVLNNNGHFRKTFVEWLDSKRPAKLRLL
jgi:nitrate/nitrite transport system substrate-binding protein